MYLRISPVFGRNGSGISLRLPPFLTNAIFSNICAEWFIASWFATCGLLSPAASFGKCPIADPTVWWEICKGSGKEILPLSLLPINITRLRIWGTPKSAALSILQTDILKCLNNLNTCFTWIVCIESRYIFHNKKIWLDNFNYSDKLFK